MNNSLNSKTTLNIDGKSYNYFSLIAAGKFLDSIKKGAVRFTIERQSDQKLPFLNVMCQIVDGTIEVDVYRKPTNTMRLITSDSYHDHRHQASAYHAMAHFMNNIPLTKEKFEKETEKVIEIGRVNGYHESMIRSIIERHRIKKQLNDISTFYDVPKETDRRYGVRFFPNVTRPLQAVYKRNGMELVHRSEGSLRQLLGTAKDKPLELHRSGVYSIRCSVCGRIYFGMSIRKLFVRFNEHVQSAKWKNKTAVGRHIFSSKHEINISDMKLVQPVNQNWKIEYYESIHIHRHKHENLLNEDNGNITSPLLHLFTIERVVNDDVIDLTESAPDTSDDEFYECE